jgi:hypothetical protein
MQKNAAQLQKKRERTTTESIAAAESKHEDAVTTLTDTEAKLAEMDKIDKTELSEEEFTAHNAAALALFKQKKLHENNVEEAQREVEALKANAADDMDPPSTASAAKTRRNKGGS